MSIVDLGPVRLTLRTWIVVACLLAGQITLAARSRVRYTVLENQSAATFVGDLLRDGNLTGGPRPTFQIRGRQRTFVVDRRSGVIRTGEVLDREALCPPASDWGRTDSDAEPECLVSFEVSVRSATSSRMIGVDVEVIDLNDNAPTFADNQVTTSVFLAKPLLEVAPTALYLSAYVRPTGMCSRTASSRSRPRPPKFVLEVLSSSRPVLEDPILFIHRRIHITKQQELSNRQLL